MAKKPTKRTHAQTQQAYAQRMKEEGFKRVAVWVPEESVEAFKKTVARAKKKWRAPGAD